MLKMICAKIKQSSGSQGSISMGTSNETHENFKKPHRLATNFLI